MKTEILRAYKFTLDLNDSQIEIFNKHFGAARWAYNFALGKKVEAHNAWKEQVNKLVESGTEETVAKKQVKLKIPKLPEINKARNDAKGDSRKGVDGISPWWHEVNTYTFTSAISDADVAWSNWVNSLLGKRKGIKVGYPRFKKKGRSTDSFRIHHDVKKPTIRFPTYRRLRIPNIGEVRLHGSARLLSRFINKKNAIIQSVTISRIADRYYASVLCKVQQDIPDDPTKRQAKNGTVGLDWGVSSLVTLSKPMQDGRQKIPNPKHLRKHSNKLAMIQRTLSRRVGPDKRTKAVPSARWVKTKVLLAKKHHEVAVRRKTQLHLLTKRLTTQFETIAIEDLNVQGMTSSAKGTMDKPGRQVKQKSGLNRSILDTAPYELRRQLEYKSIWYGSKIKTVDRFFPSSKTCSNCNIINKNLKLSDRKFICDVCGFELDRDMNAALNIERNVI